MADNTIQIPTIPDLISNANALNYTVGQPDQSHIHVCLALRSDHPIIPLLAQYALLISVGISIWEDYVSQETSQRPDFSLFSFHQLDQPIIYLAQKPCKHYRGWIGEIIVDFLLRCFVTQNRDLLDYAWELIQPPKAEVTDGELDIVAAYELKSQHLGHISGEVKTYADLSQAKSNAYRDLEKARHWSHNRDAQIRGALNSLLRPKFGIGASQAATLAMGDERSFLPGLVHSAATQFKKRATFGDLPQRFDTSTRPSQLIGIQIVISDFGSSCEANPLQPGFFENFLQQMHHQATIWTNPTGTVMHV